ncbi:T9SS type A sorting domain-containing protein [candidate division KSB1 bacterium]|nr:T9SS type A sorting domain-containing protein [candidate division KSB1 bacterium]
MKANFPPEGTDDTPKKFSLKQNYPNPFNPRTEIAFDLPQEEKVTLKIYDLYGREVVTLLDQVLEKGRHKISWNGSNDGKEALASGMYVYRIRAGDFIASKKLLLLR